MRISDGSADVCSSDLSWPVPLPLPTSFGGREAYIDQIRVQLSSSDPTMVLSSEGLHAMVAEAAATGAVEALDWAELAARDAKEAALPKADPDATRSEEHTSELQSLMRISYAVFCLKKKHNKPHHNLRQTTIRNHI